MPTCHDQPLDYASPAVAGKTLTVALAGNPNSGKTTIFNALTGLRQKVANYPGVTVEKKVGRCKLPDGGWCNIIDLPGTYSLISRSPDEQVAMEVLRGIRKDVKTPDVVIVVIDASNLQRNLYLVSQLIELGRPLVVALNMTDVAERRGLIVSAETLERDLGVPVIPVVGYKRRGIAELKQAIRNARVAPLPHWTLPDAMRHELLTVGRGLAQLDAEEDAGTRGHGDTGSEQRDSLPASPRPDSTELVAGRVPASPPVPRAWICRPDTARRLDRYEALAERLLIGDHAADILPIREHEPVASLLSQATSRLHQLGIDPMQADVEAHYHWIESVAHRVVTTREEAEEPAPQPTGDRVLPYARPKPKPKNLTERVDAIFIHKFWGLIVFTLIMGTLFVSLFWLAQPIMDAIQKGINALGASVAGHMSDGPLRDLVKDGIFAGVGTVVVFVPQIAMLFLFLSLLEDSGYLARAAFLMDRLLSKVGLHGKSFIPLLSSFACAIPGIMATRTIENRRERLATILVAPFMSCSARLPVYTLLIGAFFASLGPVKQAGIMLACYALGILAAAGTAFAFKRTLTKGPATSFILELPSYKIPQLSQVGRQVWSNTKAFLTKAGTTIFCLSIILWAMAYYPRLPESQRKQIELRNNAPSAGMALMETLKAHAQTPGASVNITDLKISASPPAHVIGTTDLRPPLFVGAKEATGTLNTTGAHNVQRTSIALAPTWAENVDVQMSIDGKPVTSEVEAKRAEFIEHQIAAAQAEYSVSGRLGHAIEPVLKPLGFDWKIDIGLISAFAAREVFVSSMGIVYSVGGDVEENGTANLSTAMQNDKYTYGPRAGRPVWTPMVAISLLIWFVLAMQCMSTFAIVRRETAGWGWPIFMLVYMNVLAYVVSLIVYQVGSRVFA